MKYTAEAVRAHLCFNDGTITDTGREMLRAYAERIEADEGAVPVAYQSKRRPEDYPDEWRECSKETFDTIKRMKDSPWIVRELFDRPPAQTAPVELTPQERLWAAREMLAGMDFVVRRKDDDPLRKAPAAEPMAQVDDVASLTVRAAIEQLVNERDAALAKLAAAEPITYSSTQSTSCAGCGVRKHTPLRIDAMGGYVCLTCIDEKLSSLLGEFGYPEEPVAQGEAVSRDLLAIGVRARNIEITRQQRAGEPNNEDHALRVGIAAVLATQPRAVPDGNWETIRQIASLLKAVSSDGHSWHSQSPVNPAVLDIQKLADKLLTSAPQPGESA